MLVWNENQRQTICRFGIAGDFLPAAGLGPSGGVSWSDQAQRIAPLFRDLQFTIANLECPVGIAGIAPAVKASLGDTLAAPIEALDYAKSLNVSVLGIANNHLYDYGEAGAARTLQHLNDKFLSCGFGRSLEQPPSVSIRAISEGMQVGIWAAGRNLPNCATRDSIGIEPATRDRAAQALASMAEHGVHCRVAFLHAGAEATNYPDPEDVEFMDELAEMGFDVISACHSHRISGYKAVCRRNRGIAHCFYGLGSLSSGILYSELEHEGILGAIALDARGKICEVEVRPIHLDERGWGSVPSAEKAAIILDRFEGVSASIRDGNYRQAFYRDISRDLVGTQWRDVRVAFQRAGIRGVLKKFARMRPAHVRRLYHKSLTSLGLG